MPLISIIVRTKNEERWISSCLSRISEQTISDVEIILVDNNSTDKTVEKALSIRPDLKVVKIDNYLPGHSLNEGIRASGGEFIVCLSSHCIPQKNDWLETLLSNFQDEPDLAGVYGRQIPMHFTNSNDKRDLIVTFGLDKRIQKKDPFFHNANSMIRRDVWVRYPFDEKTTNIEDRLWAAEVLRKGYYLIYEPDAPVYHHHGIYQNQNQERLRNVIRIIDNHSTEKGQDEFNPLKQENLNLAVFIPVREESGLDVDYQKGLLERTVASANEVSGLNHIIVDTSSEDIAKFARELPNVEVPYIRDANGDGQRQKVVDVMINSLDWFEKQGVFFDYIIPLMITHPFRPKGLVQLCINHALQTGLDCVIAGVTEYRPCWWLEGDEYRRIDDYIHRRDEREPIHIGLPGLCSVVLPSVIREEKLLSERVGIVEINDRLSHYEIRNNEDYSVVKDLL